MPLNNLPGTSYLSAGAFGLLPYQSMASKAAARNQEMNYGMMLLQSMQQQAQEVKQSQAERDQLMNSISQMDVLQPDKMRLKSLTDDFRERMRKTIADEYKGDGRRFERERQDVMLSQFRQEFLNSPLRDKALNNKAAYAHYQTAKAKGMLAMPVEYQKDDKGSIVGYKPYEAQLQEFMSGATDALSQPDMIDYPKDVLEQFQKGYKPGAKYGVYNPNTKQLEAPLVSADELYQSVSNKGYDPAKAYYITRFLMGDQVGKLRWNVDQQAPWDAQKFEWQMKKDLFGMQMDKDASARGWANVGIARERLKMDKEQAASGANDPFLFEKAMRNPESGVLPNFTRADGIFPGVQNDKGGNGIAGLITQMGKKTASVVKDAIGITDKPAKIKVAGFDVASVGAATSVYSPNTGQKFQGKFPITSIGNEIIYVPDPKNPNENLLFVRGKIAVDDDTAYSQDMAQSFGVFDSETKATQGGRNKIDGGLFNDLFEYDVYIPIPKNLGTQAELTRSIIPQGKGMGAAANAALGYGQSQTFQNFNNSLPK